MTTSDFQLSTTSELPSSQSCVGRTFRETPRSAAILAVAIISLDFILVHQRIFGEIRACMALVAFAATVYFADGDRKSLGLCLSPKQGWNWWAYTSLKIGVVVVACIAVGFNIWHGMGREMPIIVTPPWHARSRFIQACIVAPVVEETIYRVVACGLIAGIVSHRTTVIINGLVFGFLHILYGNPSPENLIGGFFLAWAFLKSETILIPLILHSAGNALVVAAQVAGWYYLHGAS